MKPENKWPFTIKMEEAACGRESVTMRITADIHPGVHFAPVMIAACPDPRGAQLLALFNELDERGKLTTLALLATAVKLHPKVGD